MSPLTNSATLSTRERGCGDARSRGRLRSLAMAVGLSCLAALTFVSGASAGTYVIDNCPSAGNGNAGSWTVFGSPQNVKGTCSGGAGDYIGPRGGGMSPGALAGVQIGVPAGSGTKI